MFLVILSIITLIAVSVTPALGGTLVDTFDDGNMDDTFPTGKVGIGVGNNVSAHFDDFFITGDGIPNDSIDTTAIVFPADKVTTAWGQVKCLGH